MHPFLSSLYILAQEQNGNIVSQASALHSPTIVSTHQPTAVSRLINEGFVPSNPGTPRVSPDVTPHHTDDELDPVSDHSNKPRKFTRPKKHDSRTGKGQYMLSVYLTIIYSTSAGWI